MTQSKIHKKEIMVLASLTINYFPPNASCRKKFFTGEQYSHTVYWETRSKIGKVSRCVFNLGFCVVFMYALIECYHTQELIHTDILKSRPVSQ